MAVVIIWIIIIVVIVVNSASKSKNRGTQNGSRNIPAQPVSRQTAQMPSQRKKPEWKSGENDILSRAKASVEEEFSDESHVVKNREDFRETASSSNETQEDWGELGRLSSLGVKESARQKQELERLVLEKLQETEDYHSDVMDTVEDLMVKGPKSIQSFERDFVAEGMDMLNRIQTL